MLQKAAGGPRFEAPAYTSNPSPATEVKQLPYPTPSGASNIDPALSGVSSPGATSDSESARDRAEEIWVENIRVIEALKRMVAERLERHEYEEDPAENQNAPAEHGQEQVKQEQSLYPVLRAAIDADN